MKKLIFLQFGITVQTVLLKFRLSRTTQLVAPFVSHNLLRSTYAERLALTARRAVGGGATVRTFAAFLFFFAFCAISTFAQTKMYWAESSRIKRANLDGTMVEQLYASGQLIRGVQVDLSGGKMYWTEENGDRIRSANTDGTDVQTLVSGASSAAGLALDLAAGKMYWSERPVFATNDPTNRICRANLDGTGKEVLLSNLRAPSGIDLDIANGHIYFASINQLLRANIDGTGLTTIRSGLNNNQRVALELVGGKVYYNQLNSNILSRANLDGTGEETVLTSGDYSGMDFDYSNNKMYVGDQTSDNVFEANFDGSGKVAVLASSNPSGLSLGEVAVVGPTVPTMGEWGLIILSLLLLCFASVFMMRRQTALAGIGSASSQGGGIPFDRISFGRMLILVAIGMAATFAIAVLTFGYEMTDADLPGALIATPIAAYLLHLLFEEKK